MKKLVFPAIAIAIAFSLLVQTMSLHAQDAPLDRLRAYLEVDTVNPPGNEARGVTFFSKIFDEEGINYKTAESAPGRGNIWARLKGGNEPGLILLHHMDVVPATASEWNTDPLTAVTKDGYVFGRGALDTKALGIFNLEEFWPCIEVDSALIVMSYLWQRRMKRQADYLVRVGSSIIGQKFSRTSATY